MLVKFSRRKMLQGAGAAALAQTTAGTIEAAPDRKWPIEEGPDTPKLCLAPGDGGGPLPVNLQPPAASAAPAGGRGGRGGGGGGYGGGWAAGADTAGIWRRRRAPRRRRLRRMRGRPAAGADSAGTWRRVISGSGSSG